MPFITIAGADYECTVEGAQELEPERTGAFVRAFDGTGRSTVRAVKRGWQVTVFFDDLADEETLRTATQLGQQVTCGGDALKGQTVTCDVSVGASTMMAALAATYGHWRAAAVTLRTV